MILALDISTSVIGYTLTDNDGNLIKLSHLKFKESKTQKFSFFEKLAQFMDTIDSLVSSRPGDKIDFIVIEEPLKRFKGKFSNANTISLLNRFNGSISGCLYQAYKIEPIFINVNAARKLAFPNVKFLSEGNSGKHMVWEQVRNMLPSINWVYSKRTAKLTDETYDECDSYTQLLAFLVMREKQIDIQSLQEVE